MVLRHAGAAVRLDRAIDHPRRDVRRRHLDRRDLDPGPAVADGVHEPGGLEHEQAHLLDPHPRLGDPAADDAVVDDRAAERRARGGPPAQHLERALGHPDRPHRVVDAAGAEPLLRQPEALALLAEQVRGRHADVVVDDLGVAAVGPVVVAEQAGRAHDVDARRVLRDEDHALAPVPLGVRVGDAHDDQQLAARRHRARRPPLAPVDDVVVAVALDARRDVRRVRRRDVGLGHRERRPDPPVEQRIQPARLLLRRAEQRQQLHVAGVGRRAVERLRARSTGCGP